MSIAPEIIVQTLQSEDWVDYREAVNQPCIIHAAAKV
jgi:hypothetical protein